MKSTEKVNMTVERWIRIWQDENRCYVKESTFGTYSVAIENHILPYFGKIRQKTCAGIPIRSPHFSNCAKAFA